MIRSPRWRSKTARIGTFTASAILVIGFVASYMGSEPQHAADKEGEQEIDADIVSDSPIDDQKNTEQRDWPAEELTPYPSVAKPAVWDILRSGTGSELMLRHWSKAMDGNADSQLVVHKGYPFSSTYVNM